jgi:hypothetical protein
MRPAPFHWRHVRIVSHASYSLCCPEFVCSVEVEKRSYACHILRPKFAVKSPNYAIEVAFGSRGRHVLSVQGIRKQREKSGEQHSDGVKEIEICLFLRICGYRVDKTSCLHLDQGPNEFNENPSEDQLP